MPIQMEPWTRGIFTSWMRQATARTRCHERAMRVEWLENRRLFTGNPPSEVLLQRSEDGMAVSAHWMQESVRHVWDGTGEDFAHVEPRCADRRASSRADAPSWAASLTESLVRESLRRWQHVFGEEVYEWWRPVISAPVLWLGAGGGASAPFADFVATDGDLLYVLRSDRLSIVRGCGEAVPELVTEVDLSATGQPMGMFLVGDRVVVISRSRGAEPWESAVTVVDVADPTRAAVVSRLGFDGGLVASLMAGGQLRLVLRHELVSPGVQEWLRSQSPMFLPIEADEGANMPSPGEGDEVTAADVEPVDAPHDVGVARFFCGMSRPRGPLLGRYEAAESFADRIHDELLTRMMREIAPPRWYHLDGTGAVVSSESLVDLDVVLEDGGDGLREFVSVTAIDVDSMAAGGIRTVGVPSCGDVTVVGGVDELFIFSTPRGWSTMFPHTGVTAISFQQPDGHVHGPSVTARGRFQGSLLNGSAADAKDGFLRVVVEHAGGWGEGTSVLVFDRQGQDLVEVGRVDGLAIREDLHAIRFSGDRVSFVTYQTSDPLFVVDLSNPREPALLGELKVTGYSEFMQILGRDLMISLGRSVAEGEGWESFGSLQLSVFDVSDPSAPRLVDRHEFAGGRSANTVVTGDARNRGDGDPFAFGAYGAERVVTIPVTDGEGGQRIEVLAIDAAGMISSIGVIDHEEHVERTIQIGGRLVAVSNSTVTVHDFSHAATAIAEMRFEGVGSEEDGDTSAGPDETPADDPIVATSDALPLPGDSGSACAGTEDHFTDPQRRSAEVAAAVFASLAASAENEGPVQRSARGRFMRPPAVVHLGVH